MSKNEEEPGDEDFVEGNGMNTKADLLKELKVNRMPISVQIQAGKIYDTAFEAGRQQGYNQGVRKGAESAFSKLEEAYSSGIRYANKYNATAFLACMSVALHDLYGFGAKRGQRAIDRISEMFLTTLHHSQWIEETQKIGVEIDNLDVLREADGGMDL